MFPLRGRKSQFIQLYFLSCGVCYKNADLCTQKAGGWGGGCMVWLAFVCSQVHIDSCQNPASWPGKVMDKRVFRQGMLPGLPWHFRLHVDSPAQKLWRFAAGLIGGELASCHVRRDTETEVVLLQSLGQYWGRGRGFLQGRVSLLKLDPPWPAFSLSFMFMRAQFFKKKKKIKSPRIKASI